MNDKVGLEITGAAGWGEREIEPFDISTLHPYVSATRDVRISRALAGAVELIDELNTLLKAGSNKELEELRSDAERLLLSIQIATESRLKK